MIAEIRSYFRQAVNEVDSDLREHQSAVTSENIGDNYLELSYYLNIGSTTVSRINVNTENITVVTLEIYKNGYNNELENYDNAYCKAIDILTTAIDKSRITQTQSIKDVDANTIDVEPILDNDNAYKFSIQFSVKTIF